MQLFAVVMNYLAIAFVPVTDLITCVKSILEQHVINIRGFCLLL
jgi:hypothetical protein